MKGKILRYLIGMFYCISPIHGQSIDKILLKGDSAFAANDYTSSLELYQTALKINAKDSRSLIGSAYCYYNLHDYSKCLAATDLALKHKLSMGSKYGLYNLKGGCYYYRNDWKKAVKYYTKFLSIYYDQYYVYIERGYALFSLGKYWDAISDFQYSLKDPHMTSEKRANSLALVGFCYANVNSNANAIKYAELAAFNDSTHTNVLLLKGRLFYEAENYPEAFRNYQKLYNHDTTNTIALFRMSYSLSEMKQYDKAVKGYKTYLLMVPNATSIFNSIAWTLFLNGKHGEALPYADKNVELNKLDANAYDTRGCVYYGLHEYEKAILDFRKSIDMNKNSPNSYYYRALCYIKLNINSESCPDLKKMHLFPNYQTPEGEIEPVDLLKRYCNN